jgi:iron complex transport system ATP-binding protein
MSERACCLIADGVGYEIRGRALVANASLTISSGEIVAVLGPNGAGKSTLLRLLAGELTPAAGRIVLADRDMSTLRAPDLARLRAVVAQASNLNFPFTVQEVVRLGVSVPGLTRGSPRIEATVADVIARVGLTAFSGRLFTELSGGERQRVHIARALCQLAVAREACAGGRLLLLDEPTSSLDIGHQRLVLNAVRREAETGVGVLAIMHDLNLAAAFADRVIIMSRARVVAVGTPRETMTSTILERAYECPIAVAYIDDAPVVLPTEAMDDRFKAGV